VVGWVLVLALVVLPIAGLPGHAEEYQYPPRRIADTEIGLSVGVAPRGVDVGRAQVDLTLTFRGPPALEVRGVELEKGQAWHLTSRVSSWVVEDKQAIWCESLALEQIEPGQKPLPTLSASFRPGPSAGWEEVQWTDLLRETQSLPTPDIDEDQDTTPVPWLLILVLSSVVLILAALGLMYARWRRVRKKPLPALTPRERILLALQRQEESLGPESDSRTFHTDLSEKVRTYLAEQLGVRAPQQTTRESLEALGRLPNRPEGENGQLQEFLDRCDQAKFAESSPTLADCRRTLELARAIVSSVESMRV
jgi:hypothetical protein